MKRETHSSTDYLMNIKIKSLIPQYLLFGNIVAFRVMRIPSLFMHWNIFSCDMQQSRELNRRMATVAERTVNQ